MKQIILYCALVFSVHVSKAQTYFYVDQLVLQPIDPTDVDAVTIDLIGGLSSTGAYVVSATAMVTDLTITIDISAADDGGLAVIVPHTEEVFIGTLDPGTYSIVINGQGVADLAPIQDHSFTVSGSGDPCDNLVIGSVLWHSFTDTAVVVQVLNTGSDIFGYPNFILFDANGDTLAKETVNFFGIGEESWHVLRIMDGADIPTGPFDGSLELWTGFTTDLACIWDLEVDLCPPLPCAPVIIDLQNLGGGIAIGTYSWTILDEDLLEVMNGSLEMTGEIQFDADTVCLAPGIHSLILVPDQDPTGGQPFYGVAAHGYQSGPFAPVTWGLPVLLEFNFLAPCVSGTNSLVEETGADAPTYVLRDLPDSWELSFGHEERVAIELFDLLGHRLRAPIMISSPILVSKAGLPPGIYFIKAGSKTVRVVRTVR